MVCKASYKHYCILASRFLSPYTHEETEGDRGYVTCPTSYSWSLRLDWKSGLPDYQAQSLVHYGATLLLQINITGMEKLWLKLSSRLPV